jgi:DNA polymerase-1
MATRTTKKGKVKPVRLVLLDAHAILHRAYHALPDFATTSGEPTGALYGLSTMLLKIVNDLKPDYIVACYDLPGPTFRHEAYEAYKGTRSKTDDALVSQLEKSRDVFKAFNIPMYEAPGFEADDMLGTIVEQLKKTSLQIIIASGDMDTMQLINDDKVVVYTLKKGINDTILYDEKAVIERFMFPPKLLPDYKGLRGDPSDNIVGIKGIGEKTATDLIVQFGSIEKMYKQLKKDRGAFLKAGIKERMITLLEEGEDEALFSKTLATIRRDAPITFVLPEKKWREGLEVSKVIALFTELQFRALSVRIRDLFGQPTLLPAEDGEPAEQFEERESVDPKELEETALALYVLDSNYLDPGLEDILNFAKTESFSEARNIIFAGLKQKGVEKVYEEIEKPLIPVVKKMEAWGIGVDKPYFKKLGTEYHKELAKLEKKIFELAGMEFNVNSPKQLSEVLFEKLQLSLKNHKKTAGGVKSTRESELEKMKDLHPIIAFILSYRELQKLLSTYIDTIPHMVGEDGRLHARFVLAGAATGRMSSQNPNLQNIPVKTELGRNIRPGFVAEKGYSLVAFDYAQIELKIAAFLSHDKKLIEIFKSGEDIHTEVAAEVFGVPQEKVDKEMRRKAKVINFGILYGMGVNALRENLGTDRAEAQEFYNRYFESFKGLADYLNKVKEDTHKLGYTETYFGRRRYFEGIRSSLPFIRASAERMAINAPIQGTSADIVKIAMARIDAYVREEGLEKEIRPLLQIHDELMYEIKDSLIKTAASKIQAIMENIIPPKDIFGITLTTSFAEGKDWGELY